MRSVREVAERALVVAGLVAFAFRRDTRKGINSWLRRERLWDSVTDDERTVLLAKELSEYARIQAQWQVERLWVLVWALERIPALGAPTEQCDPTHTLSALPRIGRPTARFLRRASLRPTSEILDQLSIIWQIRSRLVQAEIDARSERSPAGPFAIVRLDPAKPLPAPIAGVDYGVALERHLALNWLVRDCGEEWDQVSADT